jgi:hypothetical protein
MNYASDREIIESYFKLTWFTLSDTPIAFDNVPGLFTSTGYINASNSPTEYVRLYILPETTDIITMGTTPYASRHGSIVAQIFVPEGHGSGRAYELADIVTNVFQVITIGGVKCKGTTIQNIGPNMGYYHVDAVTHYQVYESYQHSTV